jgi:long-chain alkane monooxygenase
VLRDRTSGIFADPREVRPINHLGREFTVPGIHLCEPSPQRTPVLYQAGTSPRGLEFAARHAECTFVSAPSRVQLKRSVDGIRAATQSAGRASTDVLIYGQALIVTGATNEAAQARYREYTAHIDLEAALALLSGWTGVDFSRFDPDATVEYIDNDAGRTALASFSKADPSRRWTVREAAQFIGLGGRGPVIIGDPGQVADQLIDWQDSTGVDGFNLAFAVAHETFEDVVNWVVPELQRRGRYQTSYAPGTLREKLFGETSRLKTSHPGQQVSVS